MSFILIAWILNASTGAPLGFDRLQTYPTAQDCLTALNEGHIERTTDGKIRSLQCVREDQFGERST